MRERCALVLVAEPGAGKTTRVPRALLDAGFGDEGEILVLEPRRLAARMAAHRVAEELGEKVGRRVGYTVRFDDKTSRATRVRFVTEGILTRKLAKEPSLPGVSVVVLDEFHERHLHTDLGLSLLRSAQKGARPDLALVVMSATLEADPVAAFLDCEAMHVSGRTFDIAIEHQSKLDERPVPKQVGVAFRRLLNEGLDGDVLVFLPGAAEIRKSAEECAAAAKRADVDIVPLHGDLPPGEQDKAVRPGARRRLILSTNVAETSVTLPSVVAVIDSGLARVAHHSPWSGLPSLVTAKISQASAKQRAGRAGRTRAGRCVRLYTKHDHDTRPRHDEPEIRRVDLADSVLMLRAAGHEPSTFAFFEAPRPAALAAAEELLRRLGATDDGGITDVGRRLLSLPLHPRQGRLALEARAREVGPRGCLLAALLGEREIRRELRLRFGPGAARVDEVGTSDLFARLERFEAAEVSGLSPRVLRDHDLDITATRTVARVRDQLARALDVPTMPSYDLDDEEESLLLATAAAFPDRVGRRRPAKDGKQSARVVFAGGGSGELAPSSVVKEASFLVALDVSERRGSASQIRAASALEPEHLLELFPDRIEDRTLLRFDRGTEQVEQVVSLEYDGLMLDESVRRDVAGPEVSACLAKAAIDAGLGRFVAMDELENYRRRVAFAADGGLPIERLDGDAIEHAITELAEGCRSFRDLEALSLLDALRYRVPSDLRQRLERFAPEFVAIPGRSQVPVSYEVDRPPWIASHLQDFFSMAEGPAIADGRVPLVLHLLAPNKRAVQVSTDLAGFWDRHYPALRKELMRRYPRHGWPEDPRTSPPMRPKRRPRRR